MVEAVTQEPEIGATYEATVKSTTAFGAFVEILPGTEGLVHISELKHGRTEKTEDVVKKGDRVMVKLIDRDERGRLRLSMKALLPKPEGMGDETDGERPRRERAAPPVNTSDAGEVDATEHPERERSRGRGGRSRSGEGRGGRSRK
jgi:polyribonucleotide nucleotidyltransferase